MSNPNTQATTPSYWDKLKSVAASGLTTGVGIAAIAAPVLVVLAATSWISKKD
jgi:hypothetical protein